MAGTVNQPYQAANQEQAGGVTAGLAFKCSLFFGLAALLTLVFYAAGEAASWAKALSLLGIILMIAFASAASGGFVGFLFGIPHSNQQNTQTNTSSNSSAGSFTQPPAGDSVTKTVQTTNTIQAVNTLPLTSNADQQPKSGFTPSTNLEQIADWLTKIIVGVGLIELHKIIRLFNTLALSLGDALESYGCRLHTGATLAGAVIIIFMLIGFLIIYLWTYLYLINIQNSMLNEQQIKGYINSTLQDNDQKDKRAIDLANLQLTLPLLADDYPVPELAQAFKEASQNVVSSIFFKAVTIRKQYWRGPDADKMRVQKTIPIFQALISTDDGLEFPENYLELGYALMAKVTPDYKNAFFYLDRAINSFGKDKGRIKNKAIAYFNRAYCRIKLDSSFQTQQPSTPESKQLIDDDFTMAAQEPYVAKIIATDTIAKSWKTLNP